MHNAEPEKPSKREKPYKLPRYRVKRGTRSPLPLGLIPTLLPKHCTNPISRPRLPKVGGSIPRGRLAAPRDSPGLIHKAARSSTRPAKAYGHGNALPGVPRVLEGIETPLRAVSIAKPAPPCGAYQTQLTPSALPTATRPRYPSHKIDRAAYPSRFHLIVWLITGQTDKPRQDPIHGVRDPVPEILCIALGTQGQSCGLRSVT